MAELIWDGKYDEHGKKRARHPTHRDTMEIRKNPAEGIRGAPTCAVFRSGGVDHESNFRNLTSAFCNHSHLCPASQISAPLMRDNLLEWGSEEVCPFLLTALPRCPTRVFGAL
jgi:hypothetical protein